jgi:hypothetical protein
MAYFVDSSPSAGLPGEVHTTQLNDVGAVRKYSDGGSYIYMPGVATCIAGSVVVYKPGTTYVPVLVVTGAKGSVAIATAAILAANWGWFLIIGQFVSTTRTALTSNVALFAGGVAGYVDVAAVKGDQILGLYCRNAAAGAGGSAILQIDRALIGFSNESTG